MNNQHYLTERSLLYPIQDNFVTSKHTQPSQTSQHLQSQPNLYYNTSYDKENIIHHENKTNNNNNNTLYNGNNNHPSLPLRSKSVSKNGLLIEANVANVINMPISMQNHAMMSHKPSESFIKPLFGSQSSDKCYHKNVKKYHNAYCKDCGVYIPSNGSITYRENHFKQKLDHNPDRVYCFMVENQRKNRPYVENASYMKNRKILVDWMCEIAEELKFASDAIHLAISYLDTILIKIDVPKNKLQLICLTCLVIAAKFNEKDEKVPRFKDLYEFCKGIYSMDLFMKTELYILELLEWNLKTITPFQFIHHFITKGVVFSSDRSLIRTIDGKLLRFLRKYSEFFVDLSLQEYQFNQYPSNMLACGAIAGARKAVGIYPLWNEELTNLTGIRWEEIRVCHELLYEYFEKTFPEIAQKADIAFRNAIIQQHQQYNRFAMQQQTQQQQQKQVMWNVNMRVKQDKAEPTNFTDIPIYHDDIHKDIVIYNDIHVSCLAHEQEEQDESTMKYGGNGHDGNGCHGGHGCHSGHDGSTGSNKDNIVAITTTNDDEADSSYIIHENGYIIQGGDCGDFGNYGGYCGVSGSGGVDDEDTMTIEDINAENYYNQMKKNLMG